LPPLSLQLNKTLEIFVFTSQETELSSPNKDQSGNAIRETMSDYPETDLSCADKLQREILSSRFTPPVS
jgi:hypothetical protein